MIFSFEFCYKICANYKIYFLLSCIDLSSIVIMDWAMDVVILIASLYKSSFKVPIIYKHQLIS
jgi:hypothetical protein